MNNLKEYIIEKLKLNKDISNNYVISNGDTVGIFDVYTGNKRDKAIQIQLHSPKVITEITKETISYPAKNGRMLTFNIVENKYGYIQEDIANQYQGDFRRTIYLNKYDSIEFLNGLLKRNIDNVDLLHNYFDHIDNFDFENSTLTVYDCRDSVIESIKDKGIKEIRKEYEEL